MASPIRIFNYINRFTKSKSSELINLTKVSQIQLENKRIKFTLDKKDDIFGIMFVIAGGGSAIKNIYYDTHEEAKKEFDDIYDQLDKFYKK